MEQVLLVVQVLIAVALIAMVLIQRSDSDGFGLGGGSGANLLSGRATANLLTRTTAILAALFIINSLALSVLAAHGRAPSIAEAIEKQQATESNVPAVPLAGEEKSDKKHELKTDKKVEEKTGNAPAEKAAPAVPTEGDAAASPAAPVVKKHVKKAAPVVEPEQNSTDSSNE